jgi:hypothetical protein
MTNVADLRKSAEGARTQGAYEKKLSDLKPRYSFQEAADRISFLLKEPVKERDIIQFASQGRIKVTWYLDGQLHGYPVNLVNNNQNSSPLQCLGDRDAHR